MSAEYFTRVIPEPFRILGISLLPLSLGRYRLLKRFECRFVSETETTAGMTDLILGILICSMRCDEFLSWAESPRFAKDVRIWGKSVTPHSWLGKLPMMGRWWRKRYAFNAGEKCGLFQAYVKESSSIPKYWNSGDQVERDTGNWSQNIETVLRSQLNWTAEEINEQPLSKAIADYFAYAEGQGLIRLMTDEEIAQGERNANAVEMLLGLKGRK